MSRKQQIFTVKTAFSHAKASVSVEALKNQNVELSKMCFTLPEYREWLAFIKCISKLKDKETKKDFALCFACEKEEAVKMLQSSGKNGLVPSIY